MRKTFKFSKFLVYILTLCFLSGGFFSFGYADDLDSELEDYRDEMQRLVKDLKGKYKDGQNKLDAVDAAKMATKSLENVSHIEIKNEFLNKSKKIPALHDFLVKFPSILEFFARFLKDKDALPTLASILNNKTKLIIFVLCNFGTIILGMIMKRFSRRKIGFFASIRSMLFRVMILYSVRISIIIFFYGKELYPTWKIFEDIFINPLL